MTGKQASHLDPDGTGTPETSPAASTSRPRRPEDATSSSGPARPAGPSPFEVLAVDALGATQLSIWRRRGEADQLQLLQRYAWNVSVSGALWPVLHLVEVVLRNRIDQAVRKLHGAGIRGYGEVNHWLCAVPSLLHPAEAETVSDALSDLRRDGARPTPERLMQSLNFGFWTRFLGTRYETTMASGPMRLWPGAGRLVFPGATTKLQSREVFETRFRLLRDLRNAVAHHEQVCHHLALGNLYKQLVEALSWLSRDVARAVRRANHFWPIYQSGGSGFVEILTHLAEESRESTAATARDTAGVPASNPPT